MYAAVVPQIVPRFDFRVETAVSEDQGKTRDHHDDAHLLAPDLAMFAVADGMGGHNAGDVAARLALEEIESSLRSKTSQRVIERYVAKPDLESRRAVFQRMRRAVEHANERVRAEAASRTDWEGMGTTVDAVWLARDHAFIAHAGDGRVYLARSAAVLQLTQDHGQLEDLKATGIVTAHRKIRAHNRLLNAVGISDHVAVDTLFVDLKRGDRLLLCTDGVHGQLDGEAQLSELLRATSASDAVGGLVETAGERGRDNATALVIEVCDRFVQRERDDRGLASDDIERARASPLLQGLPLPSVLAALAAAVEVEVPEGDIVPRVVANDLVGYVVIEGLVRFPDERRVGAGALIFPESLVGVAGRGELPVAQDATRLMRLRADDFTEVCDSDSELATALYRRLATHLARAGLRAAAAAPRDRAEAPAAPSDPPKRRA